MPNNLNNREQIARVVDDFVWGTDDIGAILGLERWRTYRLLELRVIPTAKQVGATWRVNRIALLRFAEERRRDAKPAPRIF